VAETSPTPQSFLRRGFANRLLQGHGAVFGDVGNAAVAMHFGGPAERELAAARRLGLADLSPLPRTGFKGVGTIEWLTEQGLRIGPDSNLAYRQDGGALAARLAPNEIFLLDDLSGAGALVSKLNAAWSWGSEKPRRLIGYPMPRADSHFWFNVMGTDSSAMFSKICGVDLRPAQFVNNAIAQTSVAKMSAIVIRDDQGALPAYHLLGDSASAEYMWTCLMDAMREFDGKPVGLAALRRLGSA